MALVFGENNFRVLGFDIDDTKVKKLLDGNSYIHHLPSEKVNLLTKKGSFVPTSNFELLSEVDAIIICVPTPLATTREPDLSYIKSTAEQIALQLRKGQMVILESTTYPGSSADVLKPILETSGLKSGKEFYLAYSPEREDPGNANFATSGIPKVVGGDGQKALKAMCSL